MISQEQYAIYNNINIFIVPVRQIFDMLFSGIHNFNQLRDSFFGLMSNSSVQKLKSVPFRSDIQVDDVVQNNNNIDGDNIRVMDILLQLFSMVKDDNWCMDRSLCDKSTKISTNDFYHIIQSTGLSSTHSQSKMAAKNPRWPPRTLVFFDISTSQSGDFPRIIQIALFGLIN